MDILDLSQPLDAGTGSYREVETGYSDLACAARVWIGVGDR